MKAIYKNDISVNSPQNVWLGYWQYNKKLSLMLEPVEDHNYNFVVPGEVVVLK